MATAKAMRIVTATGLLLAGTCSGAYAQETLAGVGAAGGIAAGMGAVAATNVRPGDVTRRMPGMADRAGGGDEMGGGGPVAVAGTTTQTTTSTTTRSVRFNSTSGQTFLNELLSARGTTRPTAERRLRSPRAQAAYARRLAASTPRGRSRYVLGKYLVPPVGWRAYYVPADRYKFGKMWKYVSIEDDSGAYPVKYYYKPNSMQMLRLLSRSPRRGQPRANRVIGFYSWQDAMLAGYRPDPVSRPEPAGDVAHLARLSRSPQLARYVEYLYAGQVVPSSHAYNMSYVRHVEKIVNSKAHTRPYMGETISQVLGAILGENPLPTSVGPSGGATQLVSTSTSSGPSIVSGGGPSAPAGAADKREEDFNKFGNRAGKLANVPGNN